MTRVRVMVRVTVRVAQSLASVIHLPAKARRSQLNFSTMVRFRVTVRPLLHSLFLMYSTEHIDLMNVAL